MLPLAVRIVVGMAAVCLLAVTAIPRVEGERNRKTRGMACMNVRVLFLALFRVPPLLLLLQHVMMMRPGEDPPISLTHTSIFGREALMCGCVRVCACVCVCVSGQLVCPSTGSTSSCIPAYVGASGGLASPSFMAIDGSGNLLVTSNNAAGGNIALVSPSAASINTSYVTGVAGGASSVLVGAAGIFVANGTAIFRAPSSGGVAVAFATGLTSGIVQQMAFHGNGSLLVATSTVVYNGAALSHCVEQ